MSSTELPNQIAALLSAAEDIIEAYGAIENLSGLPKAFQGVNECLPLVEHTLREMRIPARKLGSAADTGLETPLKRCEERAEKLLEIFQKIARKSGGEYVSSVYRQIAVKLGKHRVETLMDGILEDLAILAAHRAFHAAVMKQVEPLAKTREGLAKVPPSLPDSDFDNQPAAAAIYGDGNRQFNAFGGTQNNVDGNFFEAKGDQHFGTIPPKETKAL